MDDRLEEHDDIIEIIVDYKMGFYSKRNAIRQLGKLGFEPGISEAMLSAMKKDNVVDIRGYVKTPERLKRGHDAWVKKIKGCGQRPTEVETDNK
jgi:hypothetical protein